MTLQLIRQTLSIADHEIVVELPSSQDQLLEEALQRERAGDSDADPYWGTLWATAPKLAAMVLRHTWPSRLKVLDLGCGLGVTGIAARIAGHEVTFADHASSAVRLAVSNAALNGFADTTGMVFEWEQPPTDQFDFILASDVLYDAAGYESLLGTLQAMLSDEGVVWIGEPGRVIALGFIGLAVRHGWSVASLDEFAQPCPNPAQTQFRLLVLQRRG
jgi:predicted nicotinamide N-methyase